MVSTTILDGQGNQEKDNIISEAAKISIRTEIVSLAKKMIGIPYEYGAEWTDYVKMPQSLDCSELVEGIYKINKLEMPDGSQNQFNFTLSTDNPKPADLAFFGKGKDINKIYHVGIVFDTFNIIEARGYQPESSFETGKVILRPRLLWENYKNFVGYRGHIKLI